MGMFLKHLVEPRLRRRPFVPGWGVAVLCALFLLAAIPARAAEDDAGGAGDESTDGSGDTAPPPVSPATDPTERYQDELRMLRELYAKDLLREERRRESLENIEKNRIPDPDAEITLTFDNDWFILNAAGGDWGYTNGIQAGALWPLATRSGSTVSRWKEGRETPIRAWVLSLLDTAEMDATPWAGLGVGQEMYTPRDLDRATVDPDDRPYAGWLYLAGSFQLRGPVGRIETELDVGATGTYSLAEQGQTTIHEHTDAPDPQGWDHQIADGVGVNLYLRGSRLLFNFQHPRKIGLPVQFADVQFYAETAVGNIFSAQAIGTSVRLGWIKENWVHRVEGDEFVPDRKIPQHFESDGIEMAQLYVYSRLQSQYVLYNARIQGLPWIEDEHSLAINPLVHEGEVGIYARPLNAFAMVFSSTHRTQETRNGVSDGAGHSYGRVQVIVYWY